MKPKKPTMDKIKKINSAIKKGADEKEIRDRYFGRSISRRDLFFENYKEYLVTDSVVIEEVKNEKVDLNPNTLTEILPTLMEMVQLYQSKKEVPLDLDQSLEIPEEQKRLSDVQYRSYGLSEKVKDGLEELYKVYPQYSKVAVLNFLLAEGIEKYLKKN